MITRRAGLALGAMLTVAAVPAALRPVRAEGWPVRPVKIVVAFSPGGSADQFGRLIAQELSMTFGQQFYIEYHPGSSGSIGAALTARAAPDGYTLMIGGSGPHITAPAINPSIGYDPIKDFTHIAMIGADGYGLIASRKLGITDIAGLIKLAHTRQAPLTFSSPGPGSLGQLMMEQFKREAGIDLVHVPAPNSGLMDVLGGHIDLSITGPADLGRADQGRRGRGPRRHVDRAQSRLPRHSDLHRAGVCGNSRRHMVLVDRPERHP